MAQPDGERKRSSRAKAIQCPARGNARTRGNARLENGSLGEDGDYVDRLSTILTQGILTKAFGRGYKCFRKLKPR